MKRAIFLAVCLFFLPSSASAQVVISELMFDLETGSDSGREWIEVFNSGTGSVTLTEWKLFENGSNHSIAAHTGGESLQSGAYAIIADNPAKFLEDHTSYSGLLLDSAFSLSNSGETLVLRCCGSELSDKDSISYSSETGAAGDGKTLHRTSISATSFSAATLSPGSGSLVASAPQAEEENQQEEDETSTSTPQTTSTTAYQSSYVPPPVPVLFADGGDDRVVIVGADVDFRGRAYNRKQDFVDNVRFSWNFGDGTVSEGQNVLHHFEYPGRYMVVLSIALDHAAYSDRMIITAEPARLLFSVLPDSSVAIENHAGKNLDLSRWRIRSFGREFVLPEDTVLLAGATLRIPQKTFGFTVGPQTELQYPNGLLALRSGEGAAASAGTPVRAQVKNSTPAPPVAPKAVPKKQAVVAAPAGEADDAEPIIGLSTAEAQTAAAGEINFGAWQWWLGVLGFAGIAGAGAAMAKRLGRKEWNIVEESHEDV